MLEQPLFRKAARVCKVVYSEATNVVNGLVELLDLGRGKSIGVLLWVYLGVVKDLVPEGFSK